MIIKIFLNFIYKEASEFFRGFFVSFNLLFPYYPSFVAGFDDGVGEGFDFTSITVSALPSGLFLARSTRIGAATNTDE